MKRLQLDTLPSSSTTAATRPQPASNAVNDWQRAWQAGANESGATCRSAFGPAPVLESDDSVGLESDLSVGSPEVATPSAGAHRQSDSAARIECRSDVSPTAAPDSTDNAAGTGDAADTAILPPLQGEGQGGDGGEAQPPIAALASSAHPAPGAEMQGTAATLQGAGQPPPRPLKAGQLAWQSTQAMAQRARRNDEAADIQAASPPQQPALLAVPMLAPPLPHAAPLLPGELLLAAVERMLVTEADGDGEQRVHLTFASDWFNETAVTLSRTDGGWRLDIASASPRITAALRGACNELGSRFSQRGLGRLDTRIRTTSRWDSLEEDAS